MGELSNEATIARTDGIKKVIKEKFPDIKVTREQTANWTPKGGKRCLFVSCGEVSCRRRFGGIRLIFN